MVELCLAPLEKRFALCVCGLLLLKCTQGHLLDFGEKEQYNSEFMNLGLDSCLKVCPIMMLLKTKPDINTLFCQS